MSNETNLRGTTQYNDYNIDISKMNPYLFVQNAYEGSGGFYDGMFLSKFEREMNFADRRKQAYYKNFTKGILNSIIDPVYVNEPKRKTNNEVFEEFIKNCDNAGNSLTSINRSACRNARMNSVVFTVMDNFEETPELQVDVIGDRRFPYVYIKTSDAVKAHTCDEFGNLTSIMFYDAIIQIDKDNVQSYRYWTSNYSVIMTQGDEGFVERGEKKYHGLGVVPVIATRVEASGDYLPMPVFYDIAKLNLAIYNVDSEITNLQRQQAFSLLVLPTNDQNPNIEIGANSIITVDPQSSIMPDFISPDAAIMTVMQTQSKDLVSAILACANVLGATAINSGNGTKSGVALSYEFLGQNISLKKTSEMAEEYEEKVAELFGRYINMDIELEVEYSTNYKASMADTVSKFDIIERMINLNASESINNQLKYGLVAIIGEMFTMEDDDIDKLIGMITQENSIE